MANNFEDANAKCPFFSKTKNERIICEGVTEGCASVLKFENKQSLSKYKIRHCDADYEKCVLCKALEEKYAEKQ